MADLAQLSVKKLRISNRSDTVQTALLAEDIQPCGLKRQRDVLTVALPMWLSRPTGTSHRSS